MTWHAVETSQFVESHGCSVGQDCNSRQDSFQLFCEQKKKITLKCWISLDVNEWICIKLGMVIIIIK